MLLVETGAGFLRVLTPTCTCAPHVSLSPSPPHCNTGALTCAHMQACAVFTITPTFPSPHVGAPPRAPGRADARSGCCSPVSKSGLGDSSRRYRPEPVGKPGRPGSQQGTEQPSLGVSWRSQGGRCPLVPFRGRDHSLPAGHSPPAVPTRSTRVVSEGALLLYNRCGQGGAAAHPPGWSVCSPSFLPGLHCHTCLELGVFRPRVAPPGPQPVSAGPGRRRPW